jgi:hypothetical protein
VDRSRQRARVVSFTAPTSTFGIRSVRRSLIEAAEKALEVDDPECQEIAERLPREVGNIPS